MPAAARTRLWTGGGRRWLTGGGPTVSLGFMEPPIPSAAPPDETLVLASGSPRRRELLARARLAFAVRPADIPEVRRPGEAPEALAERLAVEKALAVARQLAGAGARWVLGADTLVVVGEAVLGKPADPDDAAALLSRLVGRVHRVLTGIAVVVAPALAVHSRVVESRVAMRPAGDAEIRRYVASGEPLDKAGAYAVQGEGRRFVERVEGSESNVIGMPLEETLALLAEAGFDGPG